MSTAVPPTRQRFDVCVLDDYPIAVAHRFVNWCTAIISQQACVHVALTGGNTARVVYQALGRPEILAGLDTQHIEFYEGDERPVPPSSPDSNWGMAEQAFLDAANVPSAHRHRMQGESADLDAEARRYEQVLRDRLPRHGEWPAFDLLLLGLGSNGHVASLFPGTAALGEAGRIVVANHVPSLQLTRLTITYPTINAARTIWIIVSGEEKAEVVRRAIEDRDPALPVSHIAPLGGTVTFLLDRAAAAKLKGSGF